MPGGGKSPYPAIRIPVNRAPAMPGAPRERRVRPLDARTLARVVRMETRATDSGTVAGVNPRGGNAVWGSRVAPVTGRKSRKSPGWSSDIAGGSHIVAPGV